MSTFKRRLGRVVGICSFILVVFLLGLVVKGCLAMSDFEPMVSSPTGEALQEADYPYVRFTVKMDLINLADHVVTETHGSLFCIQSSTNGIYSFNTKDSEGGYHLHMVPAYLTTTYEVDDAHEIVISGVYLGSKSYSSELHHSEIHRCIDGGNFEEFLSLVEADGFALVNSIEIYVPKGTIVEQYVLDAG